METEILQPWKTIGGAGTVTTVTQEEEGWLNLSGASDAVFWIDVRAVAPSGTGTIIGSLVVGQLPMKDHALHGFG